MFATLRSYGVVPVVAVESVDDGLRLCEALLDGGLPVAEITFRTQAAEAVIREAGKRFPDILLGAGTVLNVPDLQRAFGAGAKFAVAPGCNPMVVSAAVERGYAFSPGVCTPSDIERALELGVTELKFFPAEASGGVSMLKSMSAPYLHLGVQFCPTGGVNKGNMLDYLALPQVAFVGGSWLAKKDTIRAGDWGAITRLAGEAVEATRGRPR